MKNWQRRLAALALAGVLTLSPFAGAAEVKEEALPEAKNDTIVVTLTDAGEKAAHPAATDADIWLPLTDGSKEIPAELLDVSLPDAGKPETPYFWVENDALIRRNLTKEEQAGWTGADHAAYNEAYAALTTLVYPSGQYSKAAEDAKQAAKNGETEISVKLPNAGEPKQPFFTIDGYDLDARALDDDEVKNWTDADWDAYYDAFDALLDYLSEKEQAEFSYNGKSYEEMTDADWDAYFEEQNAAWEAEWAKQQAETQKTTRETYGLSDSGINVMLDGKGVQFPDAKPESRDGRTMVPFRTITEALGGEVLFHASSKAITAKVGGRTLDFAMGGTKLIVTDAGGTTKTVEMDAAPYGKDGRVYVPVRFFAQALDFDVKWDGAYKTAVLVNKPAKIAALNEKLTIYSELLKNQKPVDAEKTYRTILELALAANADGLKFDLGGKLDILNRGANMSIDVQLDLEDIAKLLTDGYMLDEDMAKKVAAALKKGDVEVILNTDEDVVYFKSDMLLSALSAMQRDEPASAVYKVILPEDNSDDHNGLDSWLVSWRIEKMLEGRLGLVQGNGDVRATTQDDGSIILSGFSDETLDKAAEEITKPVSVEIRDADNKVWLTGKDIQMSDYDFDWEAMYELGEIPEIANVLLLLTNEGDKKMDEALAAVAARKDGKPLELVVDGMTVATASSAKKTGAESGFEKDTYSFECDLDLETLECYLNIMNAGSFEVAFELLETHPAEKAKAFPISGSNIWFKYEGVNEIMGEAFSVYEETLAEMQDLIESPGTLVYSMCDAMIWDSLSYETRYAEMTSGVLAVLGDDAFVKKGSQYVNDFSALKALLDEADIKLSGKLTIGGNAIDLNLTVRDEDENSLRMTANAKQGKGSIVLEMRGAQGESFKMTMNLSQTESNAEVPAAPPEGATVFDVSDLEDLL